MKTIGPTRSATLVATALLLLAARGGASSDPREDAGLAATLARVGERVAAFFSRAQSLICIETVSIRPLDHGLTSQGFGRTVESELRLWWDASADGAPVPAAQTRRQVLTVNNRAPRKNDPGGCTVQEQLDTEMQPLSMLLPEQRRDYVFSLAGAGRVDGRAAMMIDFRQVAPASIDVRTIDETCVGYDVTGGFRGRLWIDRETLDVLRLDQRLGGLVEVRLPRALVRQPGAVSHWTLERWDTSIRFGGVTFRDPDESLVLPRSSVTLQITRGSSAPRQRIEIKYANYKRFLTGGRVVGAEDGRDAR